MAPPTELLMTEGTADAPPQPVTTLYVGNLPPTVDEQILFQTFRPFGHIPDIQVACHPLFPDWILLFTHFSSENTSPASYPGVG